MITFTAQIHVRVHVHIKPGLLLDPVPSLLDGTSPWKRSLSLPPFLRRLLNGPPNMQHIIPESVQQKQRDDAKYSIGDARDATHAQREERRKGGGGVRQEATLSHSRGFPRKLPLSGKKSQVKPAPHPRTLLRRVYASTATAVRYSSAIRPTGGGVLTASSFSLSFSLCIHLLPHDGFCHPRGAPTPDPRFVGLPSWKSPASRYVSFLSRLLCMLR